MLGQLICCHRQGPNKLEVKLLALHLLPYEVILDRNVLASLVEHRIFRQLDGRLVVEQQQCKGDRLNARKWIWTMEWMFNASYMNFIERVNN